MQRLLNADHITHVIILPISFLKWKHLRNFFRLACVEFIYVACARNNFWHVSRVRTLLLKIAKNNLIGFISHWKRNRSIQPCVALLINATRIIVLTNWLQSIQTLNEWISYIDVTLHISFSFPHPSGPITDSATCNI